MGSRSTRGMAALVLISTFATGLLGGVVIERVVLSRAQDAEVSPGRADVDDNRPAGPRRRGRRMRSAADLKRQSDVIARRLDLTAEQRVQVDSIMARGVPRLNALEDITRASMDSLLDGIRAELTAVLTPEQRTRLDEVLRPPRRGRTPPPP